MGLLFQEAIMGGVDIYSTSQGLVDFSLSIV